MMLNYDFKQSPLCFSVSAAKPMLVFKFFFTFVVRLPSEVTRTCVLYSEAKSFNMLAARPYVPLDWY
eukprot:6201298-Pleurochrysis_carterae.AAC.1